MKWQKDKIRVYVLAATLIVCSVAALTDAADAVWTGSAGDSDWFNALNWQGDLVPVQDDHISIEGAAVVADSFVALADGGRLDVSDSNVVFGDLIVARTGHADFDADLTAGSLVTRKTTVGELSDFVSTLGIMSVFSDAEDARVWENGPLLTIGASGFGILMTDGVDVVSGSMSAGLFHDSWGRWEILRGDASIQDDITAGVYGDGAIYLFEDVALTGENVMLGMDEGAEGRLYVAPGGSVDIGDVLVVGYSGQGVLDVHGSVDCQAAVVGGKLDSQTGGQGDVTIQEEATWTCRGNVYLGDGGHGAVLVAGGGQVSSGDCYLGYPTAIEEDESAVSSSYGEVRILRGASWECGNMHVGGAGVGELRVYGQLQVAGLLSVASQGQSEGILTCSGAIETRDLYIGRAEVKPDIYDDDLRFRNYGGRLAIGSGTLNITGEFRLRQSASVGVSYSGNVVLDGGSMIIESTDAANLADLANVTVETMSTSGDPVIIEAAGADNGSDVETFKGCFAIGKLIIGGKTAVTVRLIDEIDNSLPAGAPEAVYVKNLTVRAGSTLDLNGLNLYCMDSPEIYGEVINGTVTCVRVPGDLNNDGRVDLRDFVIFKNNYGGDASRLAGDLNEDGYIDCDDFRILKANFGREVEWAN